MSEHTAVKMRAYPTEYQRKVVSNWLRCSRFVYNWALNLKCQEYQMWIDQGEYTSCGYTANANANAATDILERKLKRPNIYCGNTYRLSSWGLNMAHVATICEAKSSSK